MCLVRLLREELQLLQEQGSYVGEVVRAMDKKKVLVKVKSLPRGPARCPQHPTIKGSQEDGIVCPAVNARTVTGLPGEGDHLVVREEQEISFRYIPRASLLWTWTRILTSTM